MNSGVNLSVIIPCYNAEKTLGEQLEALRTQVWDEPWEIIVANNGSTDASAEVVTTFQKKMPNLRLVDASAKKGRGFARNVGVTEAKSDHLAFCDADDVVAPGWVAAVGNALKESPFVASRHEIQTLNTPEILASHGNPQADGLQAYSYPPFLPHAGGCGLGVRRSVHDEINGFDNALVRLQDTDYCWRVQLAGYAFTFVPDAAIHVRLPENSNDLYQQARENGEANVLLYKLYRQHGMPSLSWKSGIGAWLSIVKSLPQLVDSKMRNRWVWQFGWRLGRLIGSLKYRVLAL